LILVCLLHALVTSPGSQN